MNKILFLTLTVILIATMGWSQANTGASVGAGSSNVTTGNAGGFTGGSSVSSTPNTSVSSTPNTTVSSTPNTVVSNTPNTTVSSTPNTTINNTPNTAVSSTPNTSINSSPNTRASDSIDVNNVPFSNRNDYSDQIRARMDRVSARTGDLSGVNRQRYEQLHSTMDQDLNRINDVKEADWGTFRSDMNKNIDEMESVAP